MSSKGQSQNIDAPFLLLLSCCHDRIKIAVKKNKQKNKKDEDPSPKKPDPEEHRPPKTPKWKKPGGFPVKRKQIDQPRIRRPQHYG